MVQLLLILTIMVLYRPDEKDLLKKYSNGCSIYGDMILRKSILKLKVSSDFFGLKLLKTFIKSLEVMGDKKNWNYLRC